LNVEDMTLRDWFAGQALPMTGAACDAVGPECDPIPHARQAYAIADAMLAEREQRASPFKEFNETVSTVQVTSAETLRGNYAGILPSVDEYQAEKRAEAPAPKPEPAKCEHIWAKSSRPGYQSCVACAVYRPDPPVVEPEPAPVMRIARVRVKLPTKYSEAGERCPWNDGYNVAIDACAKALREQGIEVEHDS